MNHPARASAASRQLSSPAQPVAPSTRALVWDAQNSSTLLVARALRAHGWTVDWLGPPGSPWSDTATVNGQRVLLDGTSPAAIERVLWEHPCGALFLHGDDQVRWLLARWDHLPPGLRRHLPQATALETALSKDRSLRLAAALGVPVLPTEHCGSGADAAAAGRRLAPGGEIVLKGDGGSAGSCIRAVRVGAVPDRRTWAAVTRSSPLVLVQRRLCGPRLLVTVVYEHGKERAACAHEKTAAFPSAFGPTAFGVTRRVEEAHEHAERLFTSLGWHGLANVEFRQDLDDGRWYFMEINPRVPSSIGIQAAAGVDVVAAWAAVCAGRGAEEAPGRAYRDGVRYYWTVPTLALGLRRPWSLPRGILAGYAAGASDLEAIDPDLRRRALRLALWMSRHS